MTKFKAFLGALLTVLMLVAGVGASAAPASAEVVQTQVQADIEPMINGSDVHLEAVPSSHIDTAWIKSTNINGLDKIIHFGEVARNTKSFRPPSTNWYMRVQGPAGTWRTMGYGEAYTPTKTGMYHVYLYLATYA